MQLTTKLYSALNIVSKLKEKSFLYEEICGLPAIYLELNEMDKVEQDMCSIVGVFIIS